jgi:hypothetical protein
MDAALGGDWWQPLAVAADDGWVDKVLHGYVERLAKCGAGWSYFEVPVSDEWDGNPTYHLIFLTQHRDGLWLFNQALSGATEDFYQFTHRGQLDLSPLPERERQWINVITGNVCRLLLDGKPFIVGQTMKGVYGDTLGFARETHVRTALSDLYRSGITATNPRGKEIKDLRVVPAARRPAA